MSTRREFLQLTAASLTAITADNSFAQKVEKKINPEKISQQKLLFNKPVVISTWDSGVISNTAAWKVLSKNGRALDAVEEGGKAIENNINCCVGLGANPDRDGRVTLDACIMDEFSNCGGVAFLPNIQNPVSVARLVMEKTPHILLVGEGALQFALANGFEKMPDTLSPKAKKAYQDWLKKSQYKPVINIENQKLRKNIENLSPPMRFADGSFNHDTMGTLALDSKGNLSGMCTTSGMAFKMRGRVGDSPIIGAGLFVDNEIGAATSSGVGEEVIRIAGTHLVVELMRFGQTPEKACQEAVSRIIKRNPQKAKEIQVGFLAINKKGEVGAYAINTGFTFTITNAELSKGKIYEARSYFTGSA
jgi:N4-(beta-N-acetylglucosaminyl)-L-asparaginase